MSLDRKTICQNIALFAFKTISTKQRLTNPTPKPNLDLEQDPVASALRDIFTTTSHSFDLWLPGIKAEFDAVCATVARAIGPLDANEPINDRMAATDDITVRQVVLQMRPINKTTISAELVNYVATAADDVAADATDDSTPPPSATSTTGYRPIMIPPINRAALAGVDRVFSQATGGVITSAITLIEKLEEAQRAIAAGICAPAVLHNAVVASNGHEPSGVMKMTPALAPFIDCIPADETDDFNFDIPVYHWDAPHPRIPRPRPGYQFNSKVLRKILFNIANGFNTVLVGPPGCGKTVLTAEIAYRLGRPFFRIPVDGEMRKRDIIGGKTQVATDRGSEIQWVDGLLCAAIPAPSIIDIDEIDRADPDLQYVAHQAFERDGITILEDGGRYIPPHPHHAIIATANTRGRDDGENLYEMRNQMSEATRDRFPVWIDVTYMTPEQELRQLSIDRPGLHRDSAAKIIRFGNMMRGSFLTGKLSTTCSYRQISACAAYATTEPSATPEKRTKAEIEAIYTVLVSRAPLRSEIASLQEYGQQIYGADWPNK